MKLPLSFRSYFPARTSAVEPHLCCVVAYDSKHGEIQLFNYPSVLGHRGEFHYSGSPSHFEVLVAKITALRERAGKAVTHIEIAHFEDAARALHDRLGLREACLSAQAIRSCLADVPLSFSLVEIPEYHPELTAA
jgi:hypothetical protein